MKRIQLIKPLVFTERVSAKGNKYHAADCQGIAHGDNGEQEVFAFLMMAPYKERGTDLPAGDYTPVMQFKIDVRERKPVYEIVGFTPYVAARPKVAA